MYGFPFIMALKRQSKEEILRGFATRLDSPRETEFAIALDQIGRIAGFRLAALVAEST
jgi:2-oxo-4-hydroxy-4-carboxy-5-ureidoimidazoline decarboxylase